jgi:glycolate oxidase
MVVFPHLEAASEAVTAMLGKGILPVAIELMDETVIATVEEHLHLGLPLEAEAILILEVDGNDESTVGREMSRAVSICREEGASEAEVAQSEADRVNLWWARRAVGPSVARRSPFMLGEDISVPRSAIPEAIRRLKRLSKKYDLPIVIYGHAGDGNLHPNVLFDKADPQQWSRVQEFAAEIFATALELGGTLSGEHGVGVLKRPFMQNAVGLVALGVMRSIKDVLDPEGILNPGKVLI